MTDDVNLNCEQVVTGSDMTTGDIKRSRWIKLSTFIKIQFIKYLPLKFNLNCTLPSCRPQLRLGLRSLGLPQKDSLLLLIYYYNGPSNKFIFRATYGNLIVCNIFPA
jgi:hypothetical protein